MMKDMGQLPSLNLLLGFTYSTCVLYSQYVYSELEGVQNRNIELLSGGELQRFAIAMCCVQQVRKRGGGIGSRIH